MPNMDVLILCIRFDTPNRSIGLVKLNGIERLRRSSNLSISRVARLDRKKEDDEYSFHKNRIKFADTLGTANDRFWLRPAV